ncbi:MAG TPA: hypothetical protein VNL77_05420 [Roseiflexaceae bacterium]|nr:hypothetical protein [Roseiflexaceae bacterium]
MTFGGYRLNFDALLARIVYRWHWKVALGAVLLLTLGALALGLIPPIWKGAVTLTITAPAATRVEVDGRAWPRQLYAGDHQIVAWSSDGRASWADVYLAAGESLAVHLPEGLPEPRERRLPPAAPGTEIAQVWWADGAWRVQSAPIPVPLAEEESESTNPIPTPLSVGRQTVAVGDAGMERLATLDAYAGLADQVRVDGQLVEAVFLLNQRANYNDRSLGTVEVRGWSAETTPLTVTASLTLVRFAPSGDALLLAEQVPTGGEQVYLARPGAARTPVVAVPGHITRVSWREDGSAVVLHSRQGDRLTLTLVRLAPTIAAAVVADVPVDLYAGDLVPLTWNDAGLLWVAPDTDTSPTLWQAPLDALIPERIAPLDARAIAWLPDGALRVVTVQNETVVIGRYQDGLLMGQTTAPRVAAAADLAGTWHENELLLQGGGGAWLLDVTADSQPNTTTR